MNYNKGKSFCHCGNIIPEEEYINNKWVAVEFCSQKCKDRDKFWNEKK